MKIFDMRPHGKIIDVNQLIRSKIMNASNATKITRRRILVVDDLELNCVVTEAILKSAAYDVETVRDGLAALEALERKDYDLVLLDINMPGLNGHETGRRIQDIEKGGVRLAALTSCRGDGLREQSDNIGFEAHIERPIEPHVLLAEIATILSQPIKPCEGTEPWERPMYKALVRRLGSERMRGFLVGLKEELADLISLLNSLESDAVLHRRAHDLASIGGMLGFVDITRRCRALIEVMGTSNDGAARADLAAAAEAAVRRLTVYLAVEPQSAVA